MAVVFSLGITKQWLFGKAPVRNEDDPVLALLSLELDGKATSQR